MKLLAFYTTDKQFLYGRCNRWWRPLVFQDRVTLVCYPLVPWLSRAEAAALWQEYQEA